MVSLTLKNTAAKKEAIKVVFGKYAYSEIPRQKQSVSP
jgi:hypothetical protein